MRTKRRSRQLSNTRAARQYQSVKRPKITLRIVILPTSTIMSSAPMMTNQIGLSGIGIIVQMMGYLIMMREWTIFLATTLNLTKKSNYLYHLIYQQCNQQHSNGKIKLMQSHVEAEEQVFSLQKSCNYSMLVNFRSMHLSVIIWKLFLSEPKISQPELVKSSYHCS